MIILITTKSNPKSQKQQHLLYNKININICHHENRIDLSAIHTYHQMRRDLAVGSIVCDFSTRRVAPQDI